MAHWMNATPLSALAAEQLVNRGLSAADRAMARRWFGWHFGTRLLNAREIMLERLQDRILNRTSAADASGEGQIAA